MTSPHRHLAIAASIAAMLVMALAVPTATAKKPVSSSEGSTTTTTDGSTTTTDSGSTTTTDGSSTATTDGSSTATSDGTSTATTDGSSTATYDGSTSKICGQTLTCGSLYSEPAQCSGLTDDDYYLWNAYRNWVEGYSDTEVVLTDEQLELYTACYYWV